MIKKYARLLLLMPTALATSYSMNDAALKDSAPMTEDEQYEHSALFDAIQQKDIDAVKQYIKQHPEAIHAKDPYQQTPLHIAAWQGTAEITAFLVKAGSVVNARDDEEQSPLFLAVYNDLATVQILVSHGADVNVTNCLDNSPLHMAAEHGNVSIMEYLAKHGAHLQALGQDDDTLLHLAAHYGHREVVRFLLAKTATIDPVNEKEYTPLYEAAQEGHVLIVKDLVRQGARFRGPHLKWLPINAAARQGHIHVVAFFIQQDPHCIDDTDCLAYSAIAWATAYGEIPVIQFLLKNGAVAEGANGNSLIDPRTIIDIMPLNQAPSDQKDTPWQKAFTFLLWYGIPLGEWGTKILQKNSPLKQLIKKNSQTFFQCLQLHMHPVDLCKLIISFVSLVNVCTPDTKKRAWVDEYTYDVNNRYSKRKRSILNDKNRIKKIIKNTEHIKE